MFSDFKPVLKILLRFIIIYMVLLFAYQFFLNFHKDSTTDPITRFVTREASFVQRHSGLSTILVDDLENRTIWFYVNERYISRMVEGCNAVSVMILFLAFIFAFYKGFKTFVFAAIGLLFIHVVNFLRIAGLNMIIIKYPKYSEIGHQYFFPAIIYGSIVLLWLIWVKFFVLKHEKS